jgi:hypothetical protein
MLLLVLFLFVLIFHRLTRLEKLLYKISVGVKSLGSCRIKFFNDEQKEVFQMNLKLTQKLPVSIAIQDKFGNAAKIDGLPVWSVSAPELADVIVAEDGMSAEVAPKGVLGDFILQVSADADLGEGVKSILGELPVELLAGDAIAIAIAAGAPVDA